MSMTASGSTLPLAQATDASRVGGKAWNLSRLLALDVIVVELVPGVFLVVGPDQLDDAVELLEDGLRVERGGSATAATATSTLGGGKVGAGGENQGTSRCHGKKLTSTHRGTLPDEQDAAECRGGEQCCSFR